MLSIIIAVYNVKKYIKQCITSVLQTNIPIEIIIVHDKEKDDSFNGDEDYLQDKRVKILNKKNAGLSVARNQGLEVAKGDYVLFLDGDDYIFPQNLQQLYETRVTSNYPDIIAGNYQDEGIIPCIPISDNPFICNGKMFLNQYYIKMHSMVWRYLFKRSFLLNNSLWFQPVKYSEDIIFMPQTIYLASHIYYSNILFYNYRNTENSLSHNFNEKKILDNITAFKIMYKYSSNYDKVSKKLIRKEANFHVGYTIAYAYLNRLVNSHNKKLIEETLNNIDPININWTIFKFIRFFNKKLSLQILKIKYKKILYNF